MSTPRHPHPPTGLLPRLRSRAAGNDPQAGSVTVFLAITVAGLLLLMGLVADGGLKVRASQRADQIAAEAARAAGQALDTSRVQAGDGAHTDPGAAVAAATAYLSAAGHPGTVAVAPDGTAIEVDVTVTAPTSFLSLIGITQLTVHGHAQASLLHSVTGSPP